VDGYQADHLQMTQRHEGHQLPRAPQCVAELGDIRRLNSF
jgi:hypothetical protein